MGASHAGIFPSTFLQPVNSSKNSILNWIIKLNLFMYIFFVKPLKDFPVYLLILLTLWLRYLQTRTKANCMYLSCQLFRTHHKTLKFQQKLLPLQKKNIGKPDRMQVFSTDIHWKKITFINNVQAVLLQSEIVSKCIFWQSGDLNFNNFSFAAHPGVTTWRLN